MHPVSPEAIALTARAIRVLTVDAVRQANSGHVGLPLGCADLAVVLFSEYLRHDPRNPEWPDRDRFVLSAGHGSMLLYSLLHLSGYPLSMDDIRDFRQLNSITPGHPEHGMTPGVECTTGPLGQGMGNAVGMALAERVLAARFGPDLIDHRTYVLASDGDMMEGVASEAASLAGHLGLGRLIVLYDDNQITIDGPTSLAFSEDVGARFEAYGWQTQRIDGHDPGQIRLALDAAQQDEDRPHLILCRTKIGYGSPAVETAGAHGTIGEERTDQTREALEWELPPFELPDGVRDVFTANAERGAKLHEEWQRRLGQARQDSGMSELWASMWERKLPERDQLNWPEFETDKPLATRQASGRILNAIASQVPGLIGGSADLAGSNATMIKDEATIARGKFDGRNLCFGVREHGMGAIANGLALHGGTRPYVATFLIFSDYMRPSIRLAALTELPVTYVFTHDSIFVGEDGPTHQPVEHVAALRAIPNLQLWRPADARETVAAWSMALERNDGPCAFALTRQGVPILEAPEIEDKARRGAYVLEAESGGDPELVILASGSEVHLALAAARTLNADGRRVRAVSVPCVEQFLEQDANYQQSVLPDSVTRLAVEAGVVYGLGPLLRQGDRFHGMTRFGASAPYKDLAVEFGFTLEAVTQAARETLS